MVNFKQILLLVVAFAFVAIDAAFSQSNAKVDSLTAVLNKYPKEDTVKLRLFLELVEELKKSDTQKALNYADSAIKISETLKADFWKNKLYISKANILNVMGDLKNAEMYCQEAINFFEKNRVYLQELGVAYTQMGLILIQSNNFNAAIQNLELAIAIFEKIQNFSLKASTLSRLASIYGRIGNYNKALELNSEGLKISKSINDKNAILGFYKNSANINFATGNFVKSIEDFNNALKIAEPSGSASDLAQIYNNMANLYIQLGDYKESQRYALKALDKYKQVNDKIGIGRGMFAIASSHEETDPKAIEEYKKVVQYAEENNLKGNLFSAQVGIVYRAVLLKNYRLAHTYAQKAFKLEQDERNIGASISLNNQFANLLIHCTDEELISFGIEPKDRYEKAKEYLDKSLAIGNNANPSFTSFTWHYLSIIQEKQQNYAQAYESYKKYITLRDSVSGDNVKKQITRKEIQYEFDKKETELQYQQQLTAGELEQQRLLTAQREQDLLLNQQNLTLKEQALALSNKEKDLAHLAYLKEQAEKQEKTQQLSLSEEREKGKERDLSLKNLELSAQQKQNLYLGLLATVLLGGLGTLFYFYNALKKQKNIIAQQNELNEHTIAILSHDIKEPLLGVKLMLKKLNKDDPFVAQASQSLENQINSVNDILTNLLKMKKLSLLKKDKNATANAQTIVQTVVKELSVAIQSKSLTIQNDLAEDVLLPIAPEKLQIIVHNLLSNAVKYSFPNQKIRIFQEGKGFCIQDFGVGLSPEQRSKLMREVTASQQGTKQERGNGLGLFLVGAMLQGEAIKVVFDSPEVGGTVAKVLI